MCCRNYMLPMELPAYSQACTCALVYCCQNVKSCIRAAFIQFFLPSVSVVSQVCFELLSCSVSTACTSPFSGTCPILLTKNTEWQRSRRDPCKISLLCEDEIVINIPQAGFPKNFYHLLQIILISTVSL